MEREFGAIENRIREKVGRRRERTRNAEVEKFKKSDVERNDGKKNGRARKGKKGRKGGETGIKREKSCGNASEKERKKRRNKEEMNRRREN